MRHLRRLSAAAGLLLASMLAGCSVVSDAPLFSSADAPRHALEPGLWAMSGPGCDVRPGAALPSCAAAVVVTKDQMSWDAAGFFARAFGPAAQGMAALPIPKASAYVLADGDPDILELLNGDANHLQPGLSVAQPPVKPGYLALRILDVDRVGRIDRAVVWPVSCPPTNGDLPEGIARVAGKCVAQTADGVRSQAKVLPPFQSFFLTWVAQRPKDAQL